MAFAASKRTNTTALWHGFCEGKKTAAAAAAEVGMARRALILEDERVLRKHVARLLEREGYEVCAAETVGAFRELAGVGRYDVVLLDLSLPDGDGIRAWEQVSGGQPDAMALLMTAHGTADTACRAAAAGIVAVLPKPLDLRRLVECIELSAAA
jgi:DNA-binding NtrC family response regulator